MGSAERSRWWSSRTSHASAWVLQGTGGCLLLLCTRIQACLKPAPTHPQALLAGPTFTWTAGSWGATTTTGGPATGMLGTPPTHGDGSKALPGRASSHGLVCLLPADDSGGCQGAAASGWRGRLYHQVPGSQDPG